jgi:hypothetical protein
LGNKRIQHGIQIQILNDSIVLDLKDETDYLFLFSLIQTTLSLLELIPYAIFSIRVRNKTIIKSKESLNFLKNLSIWAFLDNLHYNENNITFDSETTNFVDKAGWEVRFAIELDETNFNLENFLNLANTNHLKMISLLSSQ